MMKNMTSCRVGERLICRVRRLDSAGLSGLSSGAETRRHGSAYLSGQATRQHGQLAQIASSGNCRTRKDRLGQGTPLYGIGILLAILLLLSCAKEKQETKITITDRFINSCKPIEEVAEMKRLTEEGKCLNPTFSTGDTIIFFKRLLVSDPDDTIGLKFSQVVKPFGINVNNSELYTLNQDYDYRKPIIDRSNPPSGILTENFAGRIKSPDTNVSAYQTLQIGGAPGPIYISRNGISSQISYGDTACYLNGFSSTGRYINIICGDENPRIILYDTKTDQHIIISGAGNYMDYMPCWSRDDKVMAFIRSERRFSFEQNSFGDIWLVRFRE